MNLALRRVHLPDEIYVRPHNYPLTIGTTGLCLAPNGQRMPVESFIVQAGNANTDVIYIGDSIGNAINGLELVPGQAWQFSVVSYSNTPNMHTPTPTNFATGFHGGLESKKVLDMANFFIVAAAAGQLLKVFYTLPVKG